MKTLVFVVMFALLPLFVFIWRRRNSNSEPSDKANIVPPTSFAQSDITSITPIIPSSPASEIINVSWDRLVELISPPPGDRRLIILIGPPASRKSKIAKALAARGFERISVDKIWENEILLRLDPLRLMQEFYRQLDAAFKAGKNIVDDNLNILRKDRATLIRHAKEFGYDDILLVHMDMPLEQCVERNSARTKSVPQWKLRELWFAFNLKGLPSSAEGRLVRVKPIEDDLDLVQCEFFK